MKKKLSLKRILILLTGMLFAFYSLYNIFIIVRDGSVLSLEGFIVSALVSLLFAVLAAFAWTAGVKSIRFVMIRRMVFIVVALAIFLLKLRMAGKVFTFLDFSMLETVLYVIAYVLTQAGMLILFLYYVFILKTLSLYPKVSVFFPVASLVLFTGSLALEGVLFFGYGIGLEASVLRTVVIRPVFYLGFIFLSVYFLLPRHTKKELAQNAEKSKKAGVSFVVSTPAEDDDTVVREEAQDDVSFVVSPRPGDDDTAMRDITHQMLEDYVE